MTGPSRLRPLVMLKASTASVALFSGIASARAETVLAVTQYSYDSMEMVQCATVRMNPAAYGSLPTDACVLGSEGSYGPDRVTRKVYDAAGQVLQVRKAVGTGDEAADVTYTYTLAGKIQDVVDANGNRAQFRYDPFSRLNRWVFPSTTRATAFNDATPATALATAGALNEGDYEAYGYDANSNRTSWQLRDGSTIAYTFDALNRQTSRTPAGEAIVNYAYDLRGLLIQEQRPSDGVTNSYAFDALACLTTETQAFGAVSYICDAAGNRTQMTWSDGFYVNYDYDAAGRVSKIRENGAISGIGVLATYSYDAQGRRSQVLFGNGTARSYAYDWIDRPVGVSIDLAGTASDLLIGGVGGQGSPVSYNPASQILSLTRSNDAYAWTGSYNVDRGYTTDGLNQYTAAGTTGFAYDARGNLTQSGASSYTYSKLNNLKSAPGATLYYDPKGRLAEYDTLASTRFYYAGPNLVAEVANPSGAVLRRYVPGPGVDEPIVWYEGGGTADRRFLQSDERGSIVAISDGGGNSVAINRYDEYGIPQAGNAGRFGYTGQTWLAEIGLYNYKARFYSPTLGRFMQTDPIGYKDQVNLYEYVGNDPINRGDSTGMATTCNNGYCTTTADTYDKAKAPQRTIIATPETKAAVERGKDQVRTISGDSEKVGYVVADANGSQTLTPARGVRAGQSSDGDASTAASKMPKNATAIAHGHIERGDSRATEGMVDAPSANGGYGDASGLKAGIPVATVYQGNVGWHEMNNGQLTFTYPEGSMTSRQTREIQTNLNNEQKLFQ